MGKAIICVHGRNFKPPREHLRRVWFDALRHGLLRDRPDALPAFDAANRQLVYYGDLSNEYLTAIFKASKLPDPVLLDETLSTLKRRTAEHFYEGSYQRVPGRPWLRELLTHLAAGPLAFARLTRLMIGWRWPDLQAYFDSGSEFRRAIEQRTMDVLCDAFDRQDEVLVIGHSLGSVIAYDAFWDLSHNPDFSSTQQRRCVDLWLTFGSPLASEAVKRRLRGATAPPERRYPNIVRNWINVAAEDDHVSHDRSVSNDYHAMLTSGAIESITDRIIYNVAMRAGVAYPHSGLGYLIHPETAREVADWLAR